MLPLLGPIVNGVLGIGKTYLNKKAEEKKARE